MFVCVCVCSVWYYLNVCVCDCLFCVWYYLNVCVSLSYFRSCMLYQKKDRKRQKKLIFFQNAKEVAVCQLYSNKGKLVTRWFCFCFLTFSSLSLSLFPSLPPSLSRSLGTLFLIVGITVFFLLLFFVFCFLFLNCYCFLPI